VLTAAFACLVLPYLGKRVFRSHDYLEEARKKLIEVENPNKRGNLSKYFVAGLNPQL
jgi:hypothetical protein